MQRIGALYNTPTAANNTLMSAESFQALTGIMPVTITPDEIDRYGMAMCMSLADALHEERIANFRRAIWRSLSEGYREWRRQGQSDNWRNARRALTDEQQQQQHSRQGTVREVVEAQVVEEEQQGNATKPEEGGKDKTEIEKDDETGGEKDKGQQNNENKDDARDGKV